MKILYLLRHGKSSWDNPELSDFNRPLNNKGTKETKELAEYMANNRYIPEVILCSSAKRTRETLEPILEVLEFGGEVKYLENLYLANAYEIGEVINSVNAETLLVVGHNPGIEDYLSKLVGEELNMKTCHLAVIDFENKILKDFLRPKDFQSEVKK